MSLPLTNFYKDLCRPNTDWFVPSLRSIFPVSGTWSSEEYSIFFSNVRNVLSLSKTSMFSRHQHSYFDFKALYNSPVRALVPEEICRGHSTPQLPHEVRPTGEEHWEREISTRIYHYLGKTYWRVLWIIYSKLATTTIVRESSYSIIFTKTVGITSHNIQLCLDLRVYLV